MSFLQTFLKNATIPGELAVVSMDVLKEEIARRQLPGDTSTVEACVALIVADNLAAAKSSLSTAADMLPYKETETDSQSCPTQNLVSSSPDATNTDAPFPTDATNTNSPYPPDETVQDEELLSGTASEHLVANATQSSEKDDDLSSEPDGGSQFLLLDDIDLLQPGDMADSTKNSLPIDPPRSLDNDDTPVHNRDGSGEDVHQDPTYDETVAGEVTKDDATPEQPAPVVVPFYDGEPTASLASFLEAVDRWAAQNCAEDFRKHDFAMGRLTGMAADWQLYSGTKYSTWSSWRDALQRRFRHVLSPDEWFDRIRARSQGPKESLQHYAGQMLVLFLEPPKGEELSFDLKLRYIVDGLNKRDHRVALRSSGIKDEDELMSKLVVIDRGGSLSKATSSKPPPKGDKNSSSTISSRAGHTAPKCPDKIQTESSAVKESKPLLDKSAAGARPCCRCGSTVHLVQNCPKPCRYCQAIGHSNKRCPNKTRNVPGQTLVGYQAAKPGSSSNQPATNQSNSAKTQPMAQKAVGYQAARPGSSSSRPGTNQRFPARTRNCNRCGQNTHLANNCPLNNGQVESRGSITYNAGYHDNFNFHPCYTCGSRQHESRNCPLLLPAPSIPVSSQIRHSEMTSSLRCRRCGSDEHYEMDCPRPCPLCYRNGHSFKNCPENYDHRSPRAFSRSPSPKRISTDASNFCYRCGSIQHRTSNCPQDGIGGTTKYLCYHCGSDRHGTKDCPEREPSPSPVISQTGYRQSPNYQGERQLEPVYQGSRQVEPIYQGRSQVEPIYQGRSQLETVYQGGSSLVPKIRQTSNASIDQSFDHRRCCYRCGSSTHIMKDCRMPCSRCDQIGHSQHECPTILMAQNKRTAPMSRAVFSSPPSKRGNWSEN